MGIDTTTQAPTPAPQSELMDIGTVAAHNIAAAIGAHEAAVPQIRQAIRDEISAMSSHFTLAVADVQTAYEVEVAKIKGVFSFVEANKWRLAGIAIVVFGLGVVVGRLI